MKRKSSYLVEQRLELQGVELEADGADGGDVLGGVLARQQQVRRLHHPRQVAVRSQLQALLLRPRLDPAQALLQPQTPPVDGKVGIVLHVLISLQEVA